MKSYCVAVGKMHNLISDPMRVGPESIQWVPSVTYLGVTICGDKSFSNDTALIKRSFFAACPIKYVLHSLITVLNHP
jgi:hypothetical protein